MREANAIEPTTTHGVFKFYEHSPDALTCSIVVPETIFSHIHRLLEMVMRSDALQFVIVADFLGFRVPHAQTETPTLQEFIEGKPLFFRRVSFFVRASDGA